jgi:hypothetical protein
MNGSAAWHEHITCVDLTEAVCRLARCRAALPARRTAFCSDRHAAEFERNHVWIHARRAARRRARWACERCGFKPSDVRKDPAARRTYRRHELRLEVNHIEPLEGAYRSVTCRNHQTNLEVLCHRCHLTETGMQRARSTASAASPPSDEARTLVDGLASGGGTRETGDAGDIDHDR